MANIFREVDEDIRNERYKKLWRRYRWWLIGLVAAMIVAVAAYEIIRERNSNKMEEASRKFAFALSEWEENRSNSAVNNFLDLAESTDLGYAGLSLLRAADIHIKKSNISEAVVIYDKLAADRRIDILYRELAMLLAAQHLIDIARPDEVLERLSLLVNGVGPWRPLANELSGLAHIRAGRLDAAKRIFVDLYEDPGAPVNLKNRAHELLKSLGGAPGFKDSGQTTELE